MSLAYGSKERLWHPVNVRKSLSGISGNLEVITISKKHLAFHLNWCSYVDFSEPWEFVTWRTAEHMTGVVFPAVALEYCEFRPTSFNSVITGPMLIKLGIVGLLEKLWHKFNCGLRRSHKFIWILNQPLSLVSNTDSSYITLNYESKFAVACVREVAGSNPLTQVFRHFSQSAKTNTEIEP
jgi:hypothetical protein